MAARAPAWLAKAKGLLADNRRMLGKLLVVASGSDECLALLRGGFRGVILMDVMMPGRNGWDTIREIKQAGLLRGNIISMLTAMDVPDLQMEGLQDVVIDYITKPFEPQELLASVRRYLEFFEQLQSAE